MNKNRLSRSAFTLIEILVAISIISVLLGFSVAAVQKVRVVVDKRSREHWRQQHQLGHFENRSQPIEMLFVGNSFSYFVPIPDILSAMARERKNKPPVLVTYQTYGAHSLEMLWNRKEPRAALADPEKKWDIVSLQEMRGLPVAQEGPDGFGFFYGRESKFVPYAKKFDKEIKARNAITMLYMTWKTPANQTLTQNEWTDSHIKLAKEIKSEVCPVGMACEKTMLVSPTTQLYSDNYPGHLSSRGGYLAACTFYASTFHESPVGLPSSLILSNGTTFSVPANQAPLLQNMAWSAYVETQKRLRN